MLFLRVCKGMYCDSSAVGVQLKQALSDSPVYYRCQHPVARGSAPPVSTMWDNVISWLEYSLLEMRFSYSLTRVIISWPIVSMQRPLVLVPSHSLLLSSLASPLSISIPLCCFFLQHHSPLPLYYTVSLCQYLVHALLTPCNFLHNLIILLLSCLTTPTLTFAPSV